MPTSSATIKLRRPTKLGCDHNQCFVEHGVLLKVVDQDRNRLVHFANQFMLFQDPFVMDIPTSTVQKVEVVRDLDEPNTSLQ